MLFSVIIPVYNVEKYLHQCVDSVLKQTFQDYELILVDDGSQDSSPSICDEYAKKDYRIHVIHKINGGQSAARNAGFAVAKGDYVVFLDSDDFYIHEHVFCRIAEKCVSSPDIISFKYKKYFDAMGKYGVCNYSFTDIPQEHYTEVIRILVEKDAFFCSAWSKVVKRSVLEENRILFDEHSRCEDMDWYFNVITHSNSMELVDDVMVGYRQRENSVTSTKSSQTLDDFIAFFSKWVPAVATLPDKQLCQALYSAMAKLYVNLMVAYASLNDYKKKSRYTDLKQYSSLLNYHSNPRVKKIWLVKRILGLKATIQLLSIVIKVR